MCCDFNEVGGTYPFAAGVLGVGAARTEIGPRPTIKDITMIFARESML